MLYTPVNQFNWSVDNYGGVYGNGTIGTNLPGHANAHTKGADTAMLVGIAEDCYGISIGFAGGSTAGATRNAMVDLLIDPAAGVGNAGATWSVQINNLFSTGATFGAGASGYNFYFPLYLKAGTAIGGKHQSAVASTQNLRCYVRLYGKPSRPELLKIGSKVQTLGANTATTLGVALTPGSGVLGSYSATLGTTNFDAWWWQVGVGCTDTVQDAGGYMFDVAANATSKIILAEAVGFQCVGTSEQSGKEAYGSREPIRELASGQDIYVRAACQSGPNSGMSAVVYAVS